MTQQTTIEVQGAGTLKTSDARAIAAAITINTLISKNAARAFGRDGDIGHVTASGFIVSPDRSQTLLMLHGKTNCWVQFGGHCDGDPDVLGVAKKEIFEETGTDAFSLVSDRIFDIDIHEIPQFRDIPAHLHHDIRYLFEMDPSLPVPGNNESQAIEWVLMEDLEKYSTERSVLVVRDAAHW
jgi:8-oxo-dGTP pyrophosphatase MutT (NUDIX family)